MPVVGDEQTRTIQPDFHRSISMDFQGAKITSDTGFLLMKDIDQRFNISSEPACQVDDPVFSGKDPARRSGWDVWY